MLVIRLHRNITVAATAFRTTRRFNFRSPSGDICCTVSSTSGASVKCFSKCPTLQQHEQSNEKEQQIKINPSQWRKDQLRELEDKFLYRPTDSNKNSEVGDGMLVVIETDEDVQPMWKAMESRVTKRKTSTAEQLAARNRAVGRQNIKQTEEDAWLEAGFYSNNNAPSAK